MADSQTGQNCYTASTCVSHRLYHWFDCYLKSRRAVAVSECAPLVAFPQRQKLFKIVDFPTKALFKPNKNYVAELEKKDYLGKAKVILQITVFYPLLLQRNS